MISSDEDSEPIVPKKPVKKSSKGPRIKKGVVISDDEDEKSVRSSKSKGKVKFEDSDNEKSLRAMMDIDDSSLLSILYRPLLTFLQQMRSRRLLISRKRKRKKMKKTKSRS